MPKNGSNKSRAPKKSAPVKTGPKKPHRKGTSAPKAREDGRGGRSPKREVTPTGRKPRHSARRDEAPAKGRWSEEKPVREERPARSTDRRPEWSPKKPKESFAGKQWGFRRIQI